MNEFVEDKDFVVALKSVSLSINPGAFLHNINPIGQKVQIDFMMKAIEKISPTNILEVGTNKGLFCYFILSVLPEAHIDTFDIEDYSAEAVNILNKRFNNRVTFIKGDSAKTLSLFNPPYSIDLAWVDGAHDYLGCISDLKNCDRLHVKNIFIDDCRLLEEVWKAINDFCAVTGYSIIDTDSLEDDRGIVRIGKKG